MTETPLLPSGGCVHTQKHRHTTVFSVTLARRCAHQGDILVAEQTQFNWENSIFQNVITSFDVMKAWCGCVAVAGVGLVHKSLESNEENSVLFWCLINSALNSSQSFCCSVRLTAQVHLCFFFFQYLFITHVLNLICLTSYIMESSKASLEQHII